ncbi:protease modulator HflC [Candidatus Nitronereus thalassa]|uniref:Protein HflC n=1 Tax=Candidatus Nitronereus thalassa TaxID=3020898 RepID=A0ABU3KC67_9BACT|nr:protease modulator HflC [Candidatus Nitronereus thalassa]MDT7043888.1 protease modulator HflC [Candidatus Nitronereus thalassa]
MKQNLILGILGVIVLLIMMGASPFFILDLTQTAIVVQLGEPKRTVTEPGLKFKIPFVQEVTYFDKRLLDYDASAREVITQDKKTILIDNFAKWKIVDALRVYQAFQTQRGALQRLDDIIYSELRVELGRHELLEIVSANRLMIMAVVAERANKKASEYGLEVTDVRIKRADLPEQNAKAVFDRMQAERERIAKQYKAEGAEEAQKIRSEAEKDREIILAEAYKEAQEIRGEGEAKAFKIYADAYRQDPKYFEFVRSMEAYRKVFAKDTTMVLSPDSEFLRFLKKQ